MNTENIIKSLRIQQLLASNNVEAFRIGREIKKLQAEIKKGQLSKL